MGRSFRRPRTKEALDKLEAQGLWRAMALTRKISESNEKITLAVILRIHKTFLGDVAPEIAGRFRKEEDVKKLKCIEPPPGRLVEGRMYEFWRELDAKLAVLHHHPVGNSRTQVKRWRAEVLTVAAWVQYKITAIHPFCEGNGRMARLMTSLILRRYGLQESPIKIESENKQRYLDVLCRIDHHGDYEPLKKLIAQGMYATYERVLEVHKAQVATKRKN